MRFKQLTDLEIDNSGGFPLETGIVKFKIVGIEEKQSKSGNIYWKLDLDCSNPGGKSGIISSNISFTENALWVLITLCKALDTYDEVEQDKGLRQFLRDGFIKPTQLLNREGIAELGEEEGSNGKTYLKVKAYIHEEFEVHQNKNLFLSKIAKEALDLGAVPVTTTAPALSSNFDEDIPF